MASIVKHVETGMQILVTVGNSGEELLVIMVALDPRRVTICLGIGGEDPPIMFSAR